MIGLTQMRQDPEFADIDGTGVGIAIVDTGIGYHSELSPVHLSDFVHSEYRIAGNHGTHVAGIAGSRNPGIGVATDSDIVGLQVFLEGVREPGTNPFYVNRALRWIVDNHDVYNIKVVNMSLGGDFFRDWQSALANDPEGFQLIRELEVLGVTVVSAAGNDCVEAISLGLERVANGPALPAFTVRSTWVQFGRNLELSSRLEILTIRMLEWIGTLTLMQ